MSNLDELAAREREAERLRKASIETLALASRMRAERDQAWAWLNQARNERDGWRRKADRYRQERDSLALECLQIRGRADLIKGVFDPRCCCDLTESCLVVCPVHGPRGKS